MFANKALGSDKKQFIYVRDLFKTAWLELLENSRAVNSVTLEILSDDKYVRYVKRCAGLHYLGEHENSHALWKNHL